MSRLKFDVSQKYECHLIFGDPMQEALWNWSRWVKFHDILAPALISTRGRTSVRCSQSVRLGEKEKNKTFGRLGWDMKSCQKWCHESPASQSNSNNWTFIGVEAWAPDWNLSLKDEMPPDVFLSIVNEAEGRAFGREPLYNPIVFLAFRLELPSESKAQLQESTRSIATYLEAVLHATTVKPWGVEFGDGLGFSDSIQDMPLSGIFKVPYHHLGPVNPSMLQGEWEGLHR